MKVLLLAAGAGRRLKPLTLKTPKPLLSIGPERLIERHLRRLRLAGFLEVVVNLYYLGHQIEAMLGDGRRFGLRIRYSHETHGLETGGGAKRALNLLGEAPFLMLSSDTVTDIDFAELKGLAPSHAHLVLVPNPQHHSQGDFDLQSTGLVTPGTQFTFSGAAVINPTLMLAHPDTAFPMRDVLFPAARQKLVSGQLFEGYWKDVGTEARLNEVRVDIDAGLCPY